MGNEIGVQAAPWLTRGGIIPPKGMVTVPLNVALDGISLRIDDGQEAFHTMQAFITLIQEKPKEVQAAVVDTLLKAMDPGDE